MNGDRSENENHPQEFCMQKQLSTFSNIRLIMGTSTADRFNFSLLILYSSV